MSRRLLPVLASVLIAISTLGLPRSFAAERPISQPRPLRADWMAEGNQEEASFGRSVGTAGDVNGDGFDDVIVGATGFDLHAGRASVYLGSAMGLSTTAAWTAEGSDHPGAWFGQSAGRAGDVNGDGFDDVIVGATFDSIGGAAYVYLGSSSGLESSPAWIQEADQPVAEFGRSVGTAGDVNGDGFDDVIVGAGAYDFDQMTDGRVFVYLGSPTGLSTTPDWTVDGPKEDAELGWSVGAAGDVNDDGFDDVIVGAPGDTNGQNSEGRAYVFEGSATGLSAEPAWAGESDQAFADYGSTVGTAGDVNGDGFDDIVVAAIFYDNGEADEGRAFVYRGSSSGLSRKLAWSIESDRIYGSLGQSVGTAGDVNGDGLDDAIVGMIEYSDQRGQVGAAYLQLGPGPRSSRGSLIIPGIQVYDDFGRSVATAGDVNGDGLDDIIVGAEAYDHGQDDEGAAFAWYGSVGDAA
jgi:hypothetical protein